MRIVLTSVFVDDQEKALQFYTGKLGFEMKLDLPAGDFRWLTVVSSEDPDGTQLLLEPNNNPTAQVYQSSLFEQGIAAASFAVDDVAAEVERLQALGVRITMPPTDVGGAIIAVFDDTCGNLIQIAQT